ncbi:MAG TPA: PVC-type heme-binding CxxCH protein [Verrucomicrobiales bacterium]|nr:PVC-type heme-binding CxxCH protein [Verrucomicrobiales bacterium]
MKLLPAILLLPSLLRAGESLALFDGKTLGGWEGNPALWSVQEGVITGEIKDGASLNENEWLYWQGEVSDFELELEYRITGGPTANSGIQIRSQRNAKGLASGLQCDLDDGKEWLGRIYDEHGRALVMERGTRVSISPDGRRWADPFADPKSFSKIAKKDDWNTYRIKATASHVEVWVNGVFFGALDDHETKAAEYTGKLAFQLHAGPGPAKIQYRNIRLRDLGKTELPGVVKSTSDDKPEDVFHPAGADGKPLNLGFEKGNLDDWTAEGDAWEGQPIKGDTVATRKPGQASRHAGQYWIGGYEPKGSDAGTGRLTSAAFEVTHPWASFLIGGGGEVAAVRAEIVEAETGKVFHTAAGRFEEDMHREVVDMRPLKGKKVFVRLIDRAVKGWDHVNFDDFVFHNEPPVKAVAANSRQTQSPVLWHLQPNPAKPTAVANAQAQKTVAGMMLTHGFQAELIAAEPDVRQPNAFAIDEKGRLWILEAYSYPNKQPEGKGKDRIIILSDKDGDGVFETRTVFMEGLNLASGIEVGFGGVFVGAAPELLFIPDKNGDDKPDGPPEALLDGWGYQDTHETLNSFSWGPDGWLYGCQGVFTGSLVGKPGAPKNERQAVHAAVWRYHPVRHVFEVFSHGGSNQWGLDYNENGHLFMTHCRSFFGGGGTTYVIRNGHYWNQANAGYAPFISNSGTDFAPDLKNYLPAAALYDSGEGGAGKPGTTAIFGGHSHVGTMIYQGTNWPVTYRGHLFTHNLHGHQMNHQENVRSGSGYETMHAGADLMYTPDPRYMAVDLQSGPDGAVYTIDWFDQQHCHTPIEEKWDRTNGRVYRISWAATYKPVKVDLSVMSDLELANLQTHGDEWYRRNARRLLMQRAAAGGVKDDALAVLKRLAGDATAPYALRGLWALDQCGKLDAALISAALSHSSDIVRSWGVQLATENPDKPLLEQAQLVKMAKEDPSPTVRLAIASALPAVPPAQRWEIAATLAGHKEDDGDRFLPKVLWTGFATVAPSDWNKALAIAAVTPIHELADSIRWYAAQSPAGRDALTLAAAGQTPAEAGRMIRIAAFALRDETSLTPPAGLESAKKAMGPAPEAAVSAAANELAAVFGDKKVLEQMRGVLANTNASMAERKSAFNLLKRTGDKESLPLFATLLDNNAFRAAVIPLLGRSDDPAVATALLERYPKLSGPDRITALAALTGRAPLALTLVKAMAAGTFDRKQLTAVHIRQMRNLNNAELNTQLEKTWGKFNPSAEGSKATIAKFKKLYSEAPLWAYDAAKGKEVFTKVCSVCHAYGGGDAKVGPDLGGTWRNGVDYFLENIADPNAVIGDDFQLTIVTKKDDSVVAGMVEKESDTSLVVRTLTESVSIPKGDIKSRNKLAQSLMPPGLLDAMSEREALELLKFLSTKP